MAFAVQKVTVLGTFPSKLIYTAGADDQEVRLFTSSSYGVSIGGSALLSASDGISSDALDGWITVTAGDELWAVRDSPGDAIVTLLVRSETA